MTRLKVAYLLHRFPLLTETFVAREIFWMREHADVTLYSLLPPRANEPVHGQSRELLPLTHYGPMLSARVLATNFATMLQMPAAYWRALALLSGLTWREPLIWLRSMILFPKIVQVAAELRKDGVEHIHAHFAWLGALAAAVVRELTGISFSIYPHAFDLFEREATNVRRLLDQADKVITISEYNARYIASLCNKSGSGSISVVRYGIETDIYTPDSCVQTKGPLRILSVGRLIEKKGHRFLIEACAMLHNKGIPFECVIVGDGPLRHELEACIDKLAVRSCVRLLGALSHEATIDCYRTSSVSALASMMAKSGDRDGIPLTLIEAMSCGLPAVSTDASGIPELIEDGVNGLLVRQADAHGLAQALERLLLDRELRERLGSAARATILEKHSARKNVASLAALLQTVVERRAAGTYPRISTAK